MSARKHTPKRHRGPDKKPRATPFQDLRKYQRSISADHMFALRQLAQRKKVPLRNIVIMEWVCMEHGKTVRQIHAWLLRESPYRVLDYFQKGK